MNREWTRLSWLELRERALQNPPVLIPLGCVETQGPFSPVGLEYLLAERLVKDVAERTGSLALPTVPFGNSDAFAAMPGTIFIRPETLVPLYRDVIMSVIRSGFTQILCLAFHIPNQPLLEQAARLVKEETGVSIAWVNPGAMAATYLPDLFEDVAAARGHGAEPGSSLMRFLVDAEFPEQMDECEQPQSFAPFEVRGPGVFFQGTPIGMPLDWNEIYPRTGGYGNPTLGSVEIGEKMYQRLVDEVGAIVRGFVALHRESAHSVP